MFYSIVYPQHFLENDLMESQVYVRNHLQKCNDFVVEYWDREFEEYGHGEALH